MVFSRTKIKAGFGVLILGKKANLHISRTPMSQSFWLHQCLNRFGYCNVSIVSATPMSQSFKWLVTGYSTMNIFTAQGHNDWLDIEKDEFRGSTKCDKGKSENTKRWTNSNGRLRRTIIWCVSNLMETSWTLWSLQYAYIAIISRQRRGSSTHSFETVEEKQGSPFWSAWSSTTARYVVHTQKKAIWGFHLQNWN